VQSEHRIVIARPRDVRNIYVADGFTETYERIRKELA
jgi:hypothetical protein